MKCRRREFLQLAASAIAFPAGLQIATAEGYPARPVRVVVAYPPGLTPDIVIRVIAGPLSERLNQQVIVDNRPGAGSNLGAEAVVRAAPDGYTLLVVSFSNAVNATLYDALSFDIAHDIEPIVGTFRSPAVVVVTPSFPAKTVPELIAYAKTRPGQINYASAGYGTVNYVASEMFNTMADVHLAHVPYRGSYMPDLLAGQVDVAFTPVATVIEYIKVGGLRALAVTGTSPCDALPGVPTVAEFLPGYEASVWHGIGAPKSTSPAIIAKLNKEVNAVLADPQTRERFAKLGGTVIGGSPEEFGMLVAQEIEKWGKVIRIANNRPN
jgi:tripartite-type tricarboxylate transporter receptor subunit TctC